MAGDIITMGKLKQIFILTYNGKSIKSIGDVLHMSRNTVKKYLAWAKEKKLTLAELINKEEHELEKIFAEPTQVSKVRDKELEALFPWIEKELTRTGVTRWLLWAGYKSKHADGYSYSQFCDNYKQWTQQQTASMHFEHIPGDKAFIDFTGEKLSIIDKETGEITKLEVYVSILGFSQLTYVEAIRSQKKEDFINACGNALAYFGGVPKALMPDNLKSAVTKADKYEPEINESYFDFANHYQTTILPARSRKPKDKALVESAVNIAYKRIFAPLRDKEFYSLQELNQAIWELLEIHNNLPFQKEKISRREKYEQQEAQHLKPLPATKYQIKQYKKAKVMKNCHVQLDKHYYSVPFQYIGKTVKIIYTTSQVNIFYNHDRISLHTLSNKEYAYSTQKQHLSSTHQFMLDWNPEKFISWAERISPVVKLYIEKIIQQKSYPEQAFRSCIGILSQEKKVGKERLIKAIERAISYKVYNYKTIIQILKNGLEDLTEEETPNRQLTLPFHENIRGAGIYF